MSFDEVRRKFKSLTDNVVNDFEELLDKWLVDHKHIDVLMVRKQLKKLNITLRIGNVQSGWTRDYLWMEIKRNQGIESFRIAICEGDSEIYTIHTILDGSAIFESYKEMEGVYIYKRNGTTRIAPLRT